MLRILRRRNFIKDLLNVSIEPFKQKYLLNNDVYDIYIKSCRKLTEAHVL